MTAVSAQSNDEVVTIAPASKQISAANVHANTMALH